MAPLQNTIDRRSALKLIGVAGAWPAIVPTASVAQADVSPFKVRVSDDELGDFLRRIIEIQGPALGADLVVSPLFSDLDSAEFANLVGLLELREIFLTHYHADHYLGLPGMLKTFALRGREVPLRIYGPRGLNDLLGTLRRIFGRLTYPIETVELEPAGLMRLMAPMMKSMIRRANVQFLANLKRVLEAG